MAAQPAGGETMNAMARMPDSPTHPWAGKRILLVDRYQLPAVTFAQYLRLHGFAAEHANSPARALQIMETWSPDLIILDVDLPPKEGLPFLKQLIRGERKCPVLVFTALEGMDEFCRGLPVDGFLWKTLYGNQLLSSIDRLFRRIENVEDVDAQVVHADVLLGEDDTGIAENIRQTFHRKGYDTDVVASGPGIIERGPLLHPDVIVLKEVLSGMNGSLVAASLKSTGSLRKVPIVLYDEPPPVGEFHRFELKPPEGVDAFVASSEAALLLRTVERVLHGRQESAS
jgi:DNA-binding response OmpR family regulator